MKSYDILNAALVIIEHVETIFTLHIIGYHNQQFLINN